MHRTAITEYVIARFQRAKLHALPVDEVFEECAEWFHSNPSAIKARLYRAGLIGRGSAMFYTDDQIAEAYLRLRSRARIAEEMGISYYTVTAALLRKEIAVNAARSGGRTRGIRTFYYWKSRHREPELQHVKFVVGARSPLGNHMGTIRARSLQEALNLAPGKAVSKMQAYSLNRVSSVPVYNKLLRDIGSTSPLMVERKRIPLPRRAFVYGKNLLH